MNDQDLMNICRTRVDNHFAQVGLTPTQKERAFISTLLFHEEKTPREGMRRVLDRMRKGEGDFL